MQAVEETEVRVLVHFEMPEFELNAESVREFQPRVVATLGRRMYCHERRNSERVASWPDYRQPVATLSELRQS